MHFGGSNHKLFANKENRDQKYYELKRRGITAQRGTTRNQQLHPMYVEDLAETVSQEDRGFGNTIYKTQFAVLYTLDWREM